MFLTPWVSKVETFVCCAKSEMKFSRNIITGAEELHLRLYDHKVQDGKSSAIQVTAPGPNLECVRDEILESMQ